MIADKAATDKGKLQAVAGGRGVAACGSATCAGRIRRPRPALARPGFFAPHPLYNGRSAA